MKKVDVIFPAYINATIGPTGTLRRLLKNKEYLRERGYEIEIFTYDFLISKGKSKEVDFSSGLKQRSKIKEWIKKNRFFSILFIIRSMYNARKLVHLYESLHRNPDIVVFHETDCCYSFIKYVRSDAKKVLFFHSDGKRWEMFLQSYPKLKGSFFLKYMDHRMNCVLAHLDKYVFIARIGYENFLLENSDIDESKMVFFHNGVDDKSISLSEKEDGFKYRLCCTGTICRRKGQYLIIEALHLLDANLRNLIHISLIGAGPDLALLKEQVRIYHLEKNVTFEGNIPNEQIHNKLCQNNIYVLMSNNEGLPISIIEAMRAGLPIISTNVSGIPELVEPLFNGILVEPTVESLLMVLCRMAEYDWNIMGIHSRERFTNEFSFEKMKKSYCDMLDSLSCS